MGQIVKGKKKGRPSKADLARRAASGASPPSATDSERRRSLRRRNVRYNNFIDIDDYLDEFEDYDQADDDEDDRDEAEVEEDEDDEDDEDERRKQKKLKLLLKLNNQSQRQHHRRRRHNRGRPARAVHAPSEAAVTSASEDDDDDDEDSERKPSKKKRRINGGGGGRESEADEVGSENNGGNDEDEEEDEIDPEERERKSDGKGQQDSVPGTPTDRPDSYPLPDKKMLELVLDKLQKKDTYGVYSEPVDLEELPDYLDTIDHPMDFATVRKKLGNGSYCTLEEFESDVFLICSNAMKYNSSDTIYHKQARAIQELATKKFEKIRVAIERSEKEQKSEQKTKSNILAKKQMKKPLNRTIQDTVGSDFSSGATLANACQVQNGSSGALTGACERSGNVETLVENSLSLADNLIEKVEELSSGKGPLFKMGKKPSVPDDYRRATYSPCSQPVERPDTIFTTFEDELRHLIAVGLHAEYFYTRSMARFAANLGPVAWKVASKRIEQALPPGCKFGRGWVGEYEPLTAPIIMFERAAPKYDVLLPKVKASVDGENGDVTEAREHPARKNVSEGKQSVFRPTSVLASEVNNSSPTGTKPIAPVKITHLQQTSLPRMPRNYVETRDKTSKQVELNLPPSIYQNDEVVGEKQMSINSEIAASKVREVARSEGLKPREMLRTEGIIQPIASKQLDNNGNSPQGLPEGKTTSSFVSRPVIGSCNGFNKMAQVGTNQMVRGVAYFPGVQGQVLTDPVEAMRKSAEMVRNQQKPSSQSSAETMPASAASSRSDSSNNAAVAAARAWMSVGAGGFKPSSESCTNPVSAEYNPAWQLAPQFPRVQGQFPVTASAGVQLESEKNNFPFQAFMRPPFLGGGEAQLQGRPVVFPPQLAGASDMSRYGMMTPWRGGGQSQQQHQFQQKQRQDTLPPDLNIGFQSPGSPAKQSSSGVMVDSQQPDLALQL